MKISTTSHQIGCFIGYPSCLLRLKCMAMKIFLYSIVKFGEKLLRGKNFAFLVKVQIGLMNCPPN